VSNICQISVESANQPKDQRGAKSSVKVDGGEGEEDHFWQSKLLRWLHSSLTYISVFTLYWTEIVDGF